MTSSLAEEERSTKCAIAVMAKASVPGAVKTRLTPPLTQAEAADLNTAFLRDIADNLIEAGRYAEIAAWIAYGPAGSASFFRGNLPPEVGLLEAVKPGFGACLLHAIETLLAAGCGSACVLNSDSPTLPTAYLVAAAVALSAPGDRIVLGPSDDGGYYLLGAKRSHRGLFEDIEWSTPRVFGQTMARATELSIPVVVLPPWYDVDDTETLRIVSGELLDNRPYRKVGSQPTAAAHTRRELSRLMAETDFARRIGLKSSKSRVA
jgi:rSAM/selenodomain-associated transferase 1